MEHFEGAGQSEGLEIWRIEDFKPVKLDASKHGKFHEGDSYIVMKTYSKNGPKLLHDIHFWIGKESSQDEYASAALLAVELDDLLGGFPTQHRESQGHEGAKFKSYFKKGFAILKGGVKSGLREVDSEEVVKTLYRLTGTKDIRFQQAPMNRSVINEDDGWVLDGGKGQTIFVYSPGSPMRRFKANNFATSIRDDEHAGSAEIVFLDELNDTFYDAMGPEEDVSEESAESSDDECEKLVPAKLFQVTDQSGEMNIQKIAEGTFEQDLLDQEDCFILSCSNGVFAWIGKGATKEEKGQTMVSAQKFLEEEDLPRWTKVTRVIGGCEPTVFKQYFSVWTDAGESYLPTPRFNALAAIVPESEQWEEDLSQIHSNADARNRFEKISRSAGRAVGFCPDDGSGTKEIHIVEDMDLAPAPEATSQGMLFGGDSYVIKYTYEENGREKHIIYFWQGSQSSTDERAVSALKAMEMDDALGGAPTQVRVVQGSEPRHFIKMFDGHLVIFTGGKASGFTNVHDHDTYDVDGTRLFRVRGTCDEDVRAVQIQPETAPSLDTDDAFVLEHKQEHTWVWIGDGASDFEKSAALNVAKQVSPDLEAELIEEGNEPEEFWAALGGKEDYLKVRRNGPILDPRLFHCYESPSSGALRPIEVADFGQGDLVPDDVMMLDTGAEIYNWIGKGANEEEIKKALELSKKYLNSDPTPRNESNTVIFSVKQGSEPSSFTGCFPAFNPWD